MPKYNVLFLVTWAVLVFGTHTQVVGTSTDQILFQVENDSSRCHPRFSSKCMTTHTRLERLDHQSALHLKPQRGVPCIGHADVESRIQNPPPLQVTPLITSGPSENRVDLVFFSDGYLAEEHNKFLEDAMRLAQDVSNNQTFNTVKPLLNFWAAFSPSKESGIGVGGVPNDTPFGLYRDGTELRAVYYSKPEVADAACVSLGFQCNYPILLGNDPLYGGLGGEFTVITSSLMNGPLVLRHELGHSIIDIGEEYDGGFAYYGVNAAHDPLHSVPWANWLTKPLNIAGDKARVERSVMPLQVYPWTLLKKDSAWSVKFNSSGIYARHLVRFSLSGLPETKDLRVELDGEDLKWTPNPSIGLDRWHYDIYRDGGLTGGTHEVKFSLLNGNREGVAQLCSAEILEFGDETEFVSTPGYYGLFPTYSEENQTSYRPTNEDCLMRVVTSPNFCKVCLEGLWLSLLRRVDFIDDVVEDCEWRADLEGPSSSGTWVKVINLHLLPLAQFRSASQGYLPSESYAITWTRAGRVIQEFTNQTRLEIDNEHAVGSYAIKVKFASDEIRAESPLLVSDLKYNVIRRCGE